MKKLTSKHLDFLARYGFDAELFAQWRQEVRSGALSVENNAIAADIRAPQPGSLADLPKRGTPEAAELEEIGRQAIREGELGVVILNGGMATRFGGVVKGVVEVLPGRSFLGLKLGDVAHAEQSCGGKVQVYLMNSFATEAATKEHLLASECFGVAPERLHQFDQFVSVRMEPNGEIFEVEDGEISPYGPGHGDCIPAMRAHGHLTHFLENGGKHLFVSNVDNLGARVSPLILGHHIRSGEQATVELAPKWPGDVGGAPYVVDGRLQLVEQIRYPEGFDPDVVDVFNTNTFWFRADALDRDFPLTWCYVKKTVDGRPAVQIERLIGEMTRFLSCNYVRVKRTGKESRFFPVKTPDDLESGREEIGEMYS